VAAHIQLLKNQGWSHVQGPDGQHFLVGKDGRRVRFDPTTGKTTTINAATLAQGTGA
jgi:hypothetical protein